LLSRKYYDPRKEIIEKALNDYLTQEKEVPQQLYKAMRYSVFNGGQRIRPILLFSTFEMIKNKKNLKNLTALIPLAVAVELVHCASHVHQDMPIIDNKEERRGENTNHRVFGEATAVLAGDALITKAFEVIPDIGDDEKAVRCTNVLSRAISTRGLIGGQIVDLISQRKKIRLNVLRYIHLKKTGALLQASVELACIMADAEENTSIMMGNFALNMGLAYEIVEELMEEFGAYDEYGDEIRSESRSGKVSYPSLTGTDKSKKIVQKLLEDSFKIVKGLPNNDVHLEMISYIKDKLPE